MEMLNHEHGNHCFPNLEGKGILGSVREGYDRGVLLQSLEVRLDLPAVFVYGGYGGGSEGVEIGKQNDLAILRGNQDLDSPQWMGAYIIVGKENDLIGQDVPVEWYTCSSTTQCRAYPWA